ncbi:hypothetical protein K469DRAFT_314160 [Zopfia rhizophila CBS 207.26]|uniref:Uncharacterized protein n=1 Tax=Zopfia rhizophila CBS 207.26 TaxID=1314779 RepID=A0A6A6ELY4_9PEZI|nr:hypothetical protein K469DRAFT_314160 [Zopfia rhizophila CBS 207.26]
MSGPYQFSQQDSGRSPLDRQPQNLFPAGQPPSFKTNVNRMKTKKWVEAKPYSYDGDDWGEYDEYDEYGTEQEPPLKPAGPTGFRQKSAAEPSRSFTDAQRQESPQPARRNSFEAGDEHRAFSATVPQPMRIGGYSEAPSPIASSGGQPAYAAPQPQEPYAPGGPTHPVNRQASAAESDISDTPQHRRDFSPSALPPPLQTRMSPAPGSTSASPTNTKFPARKSSLSQIDSPSDPSGTVNSIPPRERTPSNPTKPLPFIRPADIYKRVEEERQKERASLESSRPSLDSLSSRPGEDTAPPRGLKEHGSAESLGNSVETGRSLQPLEPVAERKSEYLSDFNVASQDPHSTKPQSQLTASEPAQHTTSASQQPHLPQMRRVSAFDSDSWSSDTQTQVPANATPALSPPDDQGFRAVVDQAFTRTDDQSPIMSRVPSSATSALKNRNIAGGESSTPAIAEEVSESSTPVSRPVSTTMLGGPYQIPRKPSPSHSRDVSSTSLPRAGLTTPSPGESPARSPAIEPQKPVPEAESAVLSTLSPTSPETKEGSQGGSPSSYATREADIATAMRMSPTEAVPELGAAEKESQNVFLESHQNAQASLSDTAPRSRSESPSKGRVHELAGKFGEVSHSRRGSTQSNASKSSVQSWERDNSRPSSLVQSSTNRSSSPVKEPPSERPVAGREASFRPKLPGQWESYATTVPTPSEQGERELQAPSGVEYSSEPQNATSPLEAVDLTPTTAKHPVSATEPSASPSDPLAAVRAAGTAMGEAIQASVGIGSSSSDNTPNRAGDMHGHSVGDVYFRPLQLDRTASSLASSAPPTPPAKDTPESEMPPPPPLKEKSPEPASPSSQHQTPVRPSIIPQLSTDLSTDDQESDRLRKEIVASLTPLISSEIPRTEPNRTSLQPAVPHATNRESSILPSEYDSYWADGDHASPRPSHDIGRQVSEHPQSSVEQSAAKSTADQRPDVSNPSLLTRFSWEEQSSNLVPLDAQARAGAQAPKTAEEQKPSSPTAPQAKETSPSQSFAGVPDPYFGPGHTFSSTKPDPVTGNDITARAPTPPPDSSKPVASPTQTDIVREASPPPGLHVVNSTLSPEAVDMPPRLSAETSPVHQEPQTSQEASTTPQQPQEPKEATQTIFTPAPAPGHESVTKSPTTDKPLEFRDIVNLKSTSERIATYNRTRDYWANADHGLNDWIASAIAANPELASQQPPHPHPQKASSTTSRHKHTGSLSLFGKHHGLSGSQSQSTPYYEQYNSAASQVPTTPASSAANAHGHPQWSASGGAGGRSASHQMQAKGKDLLHTAGVLGGKGMTSAKGLFAKGKSRFRASGSGDKAARTHSVSSSREASEEPEFVTTPEKGPRMSMDLDGPKDEKRKRRLSSPFHRSSRSRSRPSSIVLPKNAHLDFGTGSTKHTPQRETPPAEGSRPHSFHAPDSWDVIQDPQQPVGHSTPPRGGLQPPERLGVLPSPAKSAFSLVAQERDGDVPPVPPIPDGLEDRQKHRESQEIATHRVLQSVIRHSTPPTMETPKVQDSAIFATGAPENKSRQPDANSAESNDKKMAQAEQTEDDDQPPQLDHEPVPPKTISQDRGQGPDISPPSAPNPSEAGDISPVVSSVAADLNEDEDEEDKPPRLELDFLVQLPQHIRGDISPMIPPATLTVGSAGDGPQTPRANGAGSQSDVRLSYETEQIGAGDVSPISSHAQEGETTPTKIKEAPSTIIATAGQIDEIKQQAHKAAPGEVESGAEATPTVALTPHAGQNLAAPPPNATQHRQSISPYQVVHAVQCVPSHSSSESWGRDSVAAPSQSDGSQLGDKQEESRVPPVPQIPSNIQEQENTPAAAEPEQESMSVPTSVVAVNGMPSRAETTLHETTQQQHPMAQPANLGGHKRSQSLLSAISSAISADGVPKSPTSRPSSSNRQNPAVLAKTSPVPTKTSPIPTQIVEEGAPGKQKAVTATNDDEYDLYADHNGIVKDVHVENGQPLRVATVQVPATTTVPQDPQPPAPNASQAQQNVDVEDGDMTKCNHERPMSFVFVPRDANGRAQDQINRPTPAPTDTALPPVPQIPNQLHEQPQDKPQDPRYMAGPHHPDQPQPNEGRQLQRSPEIPSGRQTMSPTQSGQHTEHIRPPPPSNVSPPPPSNASPPPQPTPPQSLAQRPLLQDPRMRSAHPQDPRNHDPRWMVDPRMHGMVRGQPFPQDPRSQTGIPGQPYSQDPRMQGQAVSSSPPRNQYELQQQMMARQATDPRSRDVEHRGHGVAPPHSAAQPTKQEEKSSSRPRLGFVFKGLASKSSSTSPQSAPQSTSRISPNPSSPQGQNRKFSHQSSVGGLPTEQVTAKKKERKPSVFGSLGNRPQSVGTESHISQESTMAQAADSRLDLRYPTSPAPFKGIPPQQPPPGAPAPPKQPQPQRASTSGVPETGKKKRFSALGSLFSRSGTTGHAVPGKVKLTKEEKKAQKTGKHSTMPPMQPPPAQQWPQRQFRPQQFGQNLQHYGGQYGPPAATPRPFPGMQGIPPQTMPPQTMSPQAMSPQGFRPQGMPQHRMPPHRMPPQGYPQPQPQLQPQSQPPRSQGSAYMDTRQIAQARQSQQPISPPAQQPQQNTRPGAPVPTPSFEHTVQRPEGISQGPPPGGYYAPNGKRWSHEQGSSGFAAIEQQQQAVVSQHPPSQRRVSSPASTHEPRYETPQIPAAYNHVSGAYTPPDGQPPNQSVQPRRPSPAQYGNIPGRQYSDPHMPPISPQVSGQFQVPSNQRTHSNSSSRSGVSPVSNPSPGMPPAQPTASQRSQKNRMSSISEASHQERPWNLNLPEGATEQEIVRARHQQYMEQIHQQQFAAQQQLRAERSGQSPSPHPSSHTQSPSPNPPQNQQESHGPSPSALQGFREVLPRGSPQPYPMSQPPQHQNPHRNHHHERQQPPSHSHTPQPLQPAPVHAYQGQGFPVQPASYPLPMSPDSANARSPVNPLADALPPPPPPKIPHSPMRAAFPTQQSPPPQSEQQQQYQPTPPTQEPVYEQQPPDEPPPSYSGPGVTNDGMDKQRPRPPNINIMTEAEIRGREREARHRQPSLPMLQHPQPASMAASPQRSSADMGADILRRQLLEQEDRDRVERMQRAETQRAESERERQDRERARQRARELERSVSGGGRVASLRSVDGSSRTNEPGWVRRGSTTRPVFELPAEEDDEPVMRGSSYPGQEWQPPVWDGD